MTESESTTPAGETPKKPARQKLPWRRRIIRALVIIVVLVIAVRLLFAVLLPAAINRVAGIYDLKIDYERSELSLLSGDAGLWHLTISPDTGGDPIATIEYVRGNISVLQLLLLRLEVWRAEADGVRLNVTREADGTVPLLDRVLAALPQAEPAKPVTTVSKDAPPLDLTSPIKLDALRLNNVRAVISDRAVVPALTTELSFTLRLSDVRSPVRPTTFELDLWMQPGLDFLRIEGTGKGTAESIDADLTMQMKGLQLDAIDAYSLPFGVIGQPKPMSANATASVHLKRLPAPAQAVGGTITIAQANLQHVGGDVAGVDSITIDLEEVGTDAVRVKSVLLSGSRLNAGRNARGNFYFGELEFVGRHNNAEPATPPTAAPSLASAATRPAVAKAEEAVPTQAGAAAPFVWSLGELKIADAKATFRDDFLTKTNTINAVLQELSVNNLVYDPLKPDATANISVKATIPDLAETLTLAGSATPFSTQRTLELTAAADGIDPVALKPYLDALGLESTLAGASFKSVIRSGIDAHGEGFRGDLQLKETSLTNASGVLFGFPLVSIEGVSHTPADGSTRVNAIRLKGPTLPIRRDADAMLAAFGLRVKGSANEPEKQIIRASDSGPTSQARPPAEFSLPDLTGLPQIAIGEFIWDDINIDFTDVPNDNTHMQVADAVIRAKNLVFGSIQVPATQPATLTAKLSAPGLVGGLAVDGTLVRPDSETYVLNIDAKSADITASQLAPYLAGLGIEPVLKAGSLSAKATGTLQLATDQISAALDASGVSYNDGEATLLAVEGAQLEARLTDNLLSLSRVAIKSPRAIIARDAEGHFIAGGLRIAPAEGAEFQRPFSPMIRLPVPIQLGSLTIDDAEVQWNDERTTAPVSVRATAGITVDNLVVGAKGAPGSVKVSLSADDLVKQLTIAGTLAAEHDRVSAAVRVDGNGLTFDRIAPYLPPGIEPRLKDGTLSLSLEANAGIAAEGGYSADVAVSDLKYNDGASSLARVAQFRASVPRFDPWGGAITIDEVSSAGVEADVTLTRSGTPELLGLAIVPAAANPQEATPLRPTAVATIPSAAAPEQQDLAALVAEARKPLPLLSVDKLDLQLNRLTIHNQLFEDAKDATLSDLRLRNLNRLEWAGENPEARPPTQFEFAAKLSPAVGQVNATATVAPFAAEPSLQLLISASGIRGEALTELAPPLKQFITGERLTEGQFALQLDAQLQPDRRGGGPPDYSRGFGADLAITNTAFRQSPEGQILAGVESIRVEGIRVEPPTGNVTAKSVEIGKPGAYILRDADGVQVFGILVKLPLQSQSTDASAAPEAVGADDAASQPSVARGEPANVGPSAKPVGGEIRIDKLQVSGLDVKIEDRSVTPATVIPLDSLDLEADGLSNRALTEPRPMRFAVVMSAGKIDLPKPLTGGVISGVLGDLGSVVSGRAQEVPAEAELEQRALFSQVAASGRVAIFPEPKGWVKASVNGLELSAIRGFANAAGVTLGGGLFDANIDARVKEGGVIDTRNRLVLTDLKLSEPENGPVARFLKLPAPLDAAIGAVQDADGSITLPINVRIEQGALQMSSVVGSAVGAVGQVVATALASAPVKIVSGVGGLFGDSGKKPREPRTVTVHFANGDASIEAAMHAALQPLFAELRKNRNMELTLRHEMATNDINIVATRASPAADDLQSLVEKFRQQRGELLEERARLAGTARASAVTMTPARAQVPLDALREIDRRLTSLETSLDTVLEQLKPGAERQADRRTRAGSLALGRQRLSAVRDMLLTSNARDAATRVRSIPPQFAATPDADKGRVVITIIEKKK